MCACVHLCPPQAVEALEVCVCEQPPAGDGEGEGAGDVPPATVIAKGTVALAALARPSTGDVVRRVVYSAVGGCGWLWVAVGGVWCARTCVRACVPRRVALLPLTRRCGGVGNCGVYVVRRAQRIDSSALVLEPVALPSDVVAALRTRVELRLRRAAAAAAAADADGDGEVDEAAVAAVSVPAEELEAAVAAEEQGLLSRLRASQARHRSTRHNSDAAAAVSEGAGGEGEGEGEAQPQPPCFELDLALLLRRAAST